MALEYSTNNILPGLGINANSAHIAKILDELGTDNGRLNYASISNAMNKYRNNLYEDGLAKIEEK